MLHHFKHRWDGFGPPSWAAPKTPGYSMTLWFVKNAWLYNITHRLYRCVSLCRGFGFSICDGSSHRHPFLSPIGQLEPLTGGAAGHLNDADYWYFRKFVTTFLNFGRNFPSPFFYLHVTLALLVLVVWKKVFMRIQQPARCWRTIWKVEGREGYSGKFPDNTNSPYHRNIELVCQLSVFCLFVNFRFMTLAEITDSR